MSIRCRARRCSAALATLWALCACGAVAQTFRLHCMTTGPLTVRMQDGRPAGWTGSGRGQYTLAVGRAAPRAAKAVSWTGQATGARTSVIDVTVE